MRRPAHIRPIFGEYYCDPKTTERLGGLLADVRDTEDGAARRYWIELSGPST
jgi:hypothetical protein